MVEQESNAQCKPIVFFSAKLSLTQSTYSTFSRELLAIYLAIKHFRHLLEGWHFSIFTNHKLLTTQHCRVYCLTLLWHSKNSQLLSATRCYTATSSWALLDHTFCHHLGNVYSGTCSVYPIWANEPQSSSSPIILYGPTWTLTSKSGCPCVWNVRSVKCTDTPNPQLAPSANPTPVSLTYMLT